MSEPKPMKHQCEIERILLSMPVDAGIAARFASRKTVGGSDSSD
jgi:hypothetical protein